jgi:hypothetical protein
LRGRGPEGSTVLVLESPVETEDGRSGRPCRCELAPLTVGRPRAITVSCARFQAAGASEGGDETLLDDGNVGKE